MIDARQPLYKCLDATKFVSLVEGGVRVCGVAVIFISKYGIAVFRVQAVCGKFKFHVAIVGEISLCRGYLPLFHDKIQILKGLPG